MGSSEEYYIEDIHFDWVRDCSWWCHDVMSPGSGHHPHSEASHRNMAIILTTLTLIIRITRDQSEDRVCHSGPIRGQLTEVAGWYQAESDLANNSRTQTSLAGQNCNHWAEVSACPVSSNLSSALNCCLIVFEWDENVGLSVHHAMVHAIPFYQWLELRGWYLEQYSD